MMTVTPSKSEYWCLRVLTHGKFSLQSLNYQGAAEAADGDLMEAEGMSEP